MRTPRDLGVPYPSMKVEPLPAALSYYRSCGTRSGDAPAVRRDNDPAKVRVHLEREPALRLCRRSSGRRRASHDRDHSRLWQDGRRRTHVILRLRSRFTQLGISTLIWDKPGCGESKGRFDADQPVESSAREVLDAIRHAREGKLPGVTKVGLWGISRAGWIAPLAITQDHKIAFWISVSGTDYKENFPYLLESNLRIEGRTEAKSTLAW